MGESIEYCEKIIKTKYDIIRIISLISNYMADTNDEDTRIEDAEDKIEDAQEEMADGMEEKAEALKDKAEKVRESDED